MSEKLSDQPQSPALEAFTSDQLMTYNILKRLKEYVGDTNPINLGNVCLNEICRDHAIQLSKDQLTMYGTQGYRSCRSTHGVSNGTFYFEAMPHPPMDITEEEINAISELQYRPQWRIGVACSELETGWAVGYDAYGFGLRSVDGSLCHLRERHISNTRLARRVRKPGETLAMVLAEEDEKDAALFSEALSDNGHIHTYVEFFPLDAVAENDSRGPFFYGMGDTVGVLLHLPSNPELPELPKEVELGIDKSYERPLVKTGTKAAMPSQNTSMQMNLEMSQLSSADESGVVSRKKSVEAQRDDIRPLSKGSFVTFFVNGRPRCTIHNLPHDRYYAAGSSFLYGSIEFNFGPRNIVDEAFPTDWRCLPFCLTPADDSRESLSKTFRHYEDAERWCVSARVFCPFHDDNSIVFCPTIKPLTSLYIPRAKDEYKEVLDVFASNQMTLDIWNEIARAYGDTVYGVSRKRLNRVHHIKK